MPALANPKHEEFAHAYVALRYDAAKAALAVSEKAAEGNVLLCKAGMAQRIRELQRPVLRRWDVTADRTMMGLARVGYADVRRLVDPDTGRLLPIEALDDDIAGAVKGFKVREEFEKDGYEIDLATGEPDRSLPRVIRVVTTEVKMNDRVPALTVLAKHFKLVNDEGDGINALASALSDRLKAARRRVTVVDSTTQGHDPGPPQEIEDARIIHPDVQAQPADASVSETLF